MTQKVHTHSLQRCSGLLEITDNNLFLAQRAPRRPFFVREDGAHGWRCDDAALFIIFTAHKWTLHAFGDNENHGFSHLSWQWRFMAILVPQSTIFGIVVVATGADGNLVHIVGLFGWFKDAAAAGACWGRGHGVPGL